MHEEVVPLRVQQYLVPLDGVVCGVDVFKPAGRSRAGFLRGKQGAAEEQCGQNWAMLHHGWKFPALGYSRAPETADIIAAAQNLRQTNLPQSSFGGGGVGVADANRRHGCAARFMGFPLARNRLETRCPSQARCLFSMPDRQG
jgi:hypothetical protein